MKTTKLHVFSTLALTSMLAPITPTKADVISDWNDTTIKVNKAAGVGGVAPTRSLALVHVAQFDAVNAATGGYTPYLSSLAAPGASAEAAAAQAAYAVLMALFPTNTLAAQALEVSLAAVPDGPPKTDGIALGNATAAALLAARAGDGFNASVHYTAPTPGPGLWEPRTNAAIVSPHWRYVNPWTMKGASQFRAGPPPALTSATYTADFNEIKALGATNGTTRTPDQTDIALFHVEVQFYLGCYAARAALAARPLPLAQSARLFAPLNMACADAAITEWDTKYTYNFWRPQTAIRNADTDGNPDTEADSTWTSLRPSPNHPEYAGAAPIVMTAAAEVLADVFGDPFSVTFESPTLPGKPRTFARFSDLPMNCQLEVGPDRRAGRPGSVTCLVRRAQRSRPTVRRAPLPIHAVGRGSCRAATGPPSSWLPCAPTTLASRLSTDAINARVYIGFHFRNSSLVGAERGRSIAQHMLRNFLLPVPSAVSGQAQTNGAFQLNLLTVGARPYVIETSSDLVSWAPWRTNLTGLVSESDPGAAAASRRFYRAVQK